MAASHSSFAFGAADDATVRCLTFTDSRPQLHIDGRHFGIMLFPSLLDKEQVTEQTIRFARELADQVGVYLAEIERLYAAQGGQPCDSSPKPGDSAAAA